MLIGNYSVPLFEKEGLADIFLDKSSLVAIDKALPCCRVILIGFWKKNMENAKTRDDNNNKTGQ